MPKTIGHTSSGKPVYAAYQLHPNFGDWTADDHMDAADVHRDAERSDIMTNRSMHANSAALHAEDAQQIYKAVEKLGLSRGAKKPKRQHAKIGREVDAILYAPGKHCPLSGSLCTNCLRYRHEHNLGNKTAAELGLTEKQYREQIGIAKQIAQELAAEDAALKKRGRKAHSTINRDGGLYPTAEARRHVQTIQRREEFPEILAISMRSDGTNYNVKVPDPKNKLGYDLVDVLIHDNGLRSIKSASRSRTTPDRASKIVARYLAATQG